MKTLIVATGSMQGKRISNGIEDVQLQKLRSVLCQSEGMTEAIDTNGIIECHLLRKCGKKVCLVERGDIIFYVISDTSWSQSILECECSYH